MRHIFIALLLAGFFKASANDTLTRAQVYNFSVGDTFDYRYHNYYNDDHYLIRDSSISYSRFVIVNIYWSADSLTKYIVRERIYPPPSSQETITLINLTGYEVILDTILPFHWVPGFYDTCITNSAPYFGQTTNYISFYVGTPNWEFILFGQGLGKIIDCTSGGLHSVSYNDSTILIYYSGSNGVFGTPYTLFPTAVNDLSSSNQKINVFPTVSNGAFTVETPDEMPLPVNFSIYDVQGRIVKQLTLSDKRTNVELQGVSRGLYVWKAYSSEKFIGTGKVVVE